MLSLLRLTCCCVAVMSCKGVCRLAHVSILSLRPFLGAAPVLLPTSWRESEGATAKRLIRSGQTLNYCTECPHLAPARSATLKQADAARCAVGTGQKALLQGLLGLAVGRSLFQKSRLHVCNAKLPLYGLLQAGLACMRRAT